MNKKKTNKRYNVCVGFPASILHRSGGKFRNRKSVEVCGENSGIVDAGNNGDDDI